MRRARIALVLAAAIVPSACQLTKVTLTEPELVVVAEAYVHVDLGPGGNATSSMSVLLHETLDKAGKSFDVHGAQIAVTRGSDGLRIPFQEAALASCVIATPVDQTATCYLPVAGAPGVSTVSPGDRLDLRIDLGGGGVMLSQTTVPGRFQLLNVADSLTCALDPLTASDIMWSRSEGAWAYVSDTFIRGLAASFDTAKVKVDDPLYLWGLSVSAQDTAIVFPGEFGVFARGDLDHEVTAMLQKGLPAPSSADISVTAVDRNWVNWARGGNFNPSGVVRVPSIRGDGTGVFASAVVRSFRVSAGPGQTAKKCPAPPAVTS